MIISHTDFINFKRGDVSAPIRETKKMMTAVKNNKSVKNESSNKALEILRQRVEEGAKKFGEVQVDFKSSFSIISDLEKLKYLANAIVYKTQCAYEARKAEIEGENGGVEEIKPALTPTQPVHEVEEAEAEEVTENTSEPTPAPRHVVRLKGRKNTASKASNTPKHVAHKSKSETKKEEVRQVKLVELTKDEIKALGIKFYQYSEKSVFVEGDTRSVRDEFKSEGNGHWNRAKQGWFFKNEQGHELAKRMHVRVHKMEQA